MNIKIVFSALLCVAAGAMASCSTETDTNTQDTTNPDVTAKPTLSVDIPSTRSTVSLIDGNKWEDGDKFIAYNITTPHYNAHILYNWQFVAAIGECFVAHFVGVRNHFTEYS